MGISSAGVGSNLDVNNIVTQLMAVEKQPITMLDTKTASYQAKLTGFGTLKGALSQFQAGLLGLSDINKFQSIKTSIVDAAIAGVSATSAAAPGSYALEVSQLAQSQKLNAAGQASITAPIGGKSPTTLSFDFGTLTAPQGAFDPVTGKYTGASFASNGNGTKTVTIDPSNNSLAGIRDAINNAGVGVTATIVNDGSSAPYRLSLSVTATGKTNTLSLSVTGDSALKALLNHDPAATGANQALFETAAAQNAEFTIDGIAVSKPSNSINDAIPGVTLSLLKKNVGTPTSINVARDTGTVVASVNAFVKSFNDINQTLKDASSYNAATGTASILNGEASVRAVSNQIRSVLSAPLAGGASTFTLLSQVGVTVQKDGSFAVNSAKLQSAIDNNFSQIAAVFSAVGKSSDALVNFTGSSAKSVAGAYPVTVSKLAAQGTTTAGAAATLPIVKGTNDTLQITLDGVTANVTLSDRAYTSVADLASEVQSKINGASGFASLGLSVMVTESGGKLTLRSAAFGAGSNVSVSGGNGQSSLGFDPGTAPNATIITAGNDVVGTINGVAGIGKGQALTGAVGDASEGLALTVTGGSIGSRGILNFTKGYANQLSKVVDTLLATDGPISSRTNGINASIKDVARNKEALTARLAATEKRYRAQFSALDSVISKMSTTSTFLTQQLANLPKIS